MGEEAERLRFAVVEVMDEAVETLRQLVQIPSITGNEEAAQEYLAGIFNKSGLQVDLWYPGLDDLKSHPAFPMVTPGELGRRPNLVGTLKGAGGGRSLILNGHMDVVNPGEEKNWIHSPWSGAIEGNMLYGRGACDMKAGLLAGFFALQAILRAGIPLKGTVHLESVIGEENGGVGTLACLVRGYTADGAVIMEPTGLSIMPVQMGVLDFRLTVTGKAAHGCVRYEGVSVVEKFSYLHGGIIHWEALREKEIEGDLFSSYPIKAPISIGTVQAGNWSSTVPEKLTAEGRYGFPVGQTMAEARKAFEEKVLELASRDPWLRENPPLVEWINSSWDPAEVSPDHPVVVKMKDSYRIALGQEPKLAGATYGSDMRLLTKYGSTPSLLFGPGDIRRAHFTDECVSLEEYRDAIEVLANFILVWCNED